MQAERRCVQGKRLGGISYFEFEAGSGGMVLDASEKGLRFQAADGSSTRSQPDLDFSSSGGAD